MAKDTEISGYASLFWTRDLNDDVAAAGAFAASLARTGAGGVRMLCQHDADRPVGVWDEVVEDGRGLFVRGRIIEATPEARMCAALVRAGALDGLSIGFRAVKARPDETGRLRVLTEIELWEVSVVTFPMLPGARIDRVVPLPAGEGGAQGASPGRVRGYALAGSPPPTP